MGKTFKDNKGRGKVGVSKFPRVRVERNLGTRPHSGRKRPQLEEDEWQQEEGGEGDYFDVADADAAATAAGPSRDRLRPSWSRAARR